jgi:hypothetical protein
VVYSPMLDIHTQEFFQGTCRKAVKCWNANALHGAPEPMGTLSGQACHNA